MLISEYINSSPIITPELETELLEMIRNEFPELEIHILNTDPQLMMPRYVLVRYEQTDFLTLYGTNRTAFIVNKLEFISQDELFKRSNKHYLGDMEREPKIIGTEFVKGELTIDDFRQLFKRLITDYKKLTVEQKKYEVQKKIEEIKKDF